MRIIIIAILLFGFAEVAPAQLASDQPSQAPIAQAPAGVKKVEGSTPITLSGGATLSSAPLPSTIATQVKPGVAAKATVAQAPVATQPIKPVSAEPASEPKKMQSAVQKQ